MGKYKGEKVDDRFEKIYEQGFGNILEIWVDRETGIQYLYRVGGNGGGLTPLLDVDGKPLRYDPYQMG